MKRRLSLDTPDEPVQRHARTASAATSAAVETALDVDVVELSEDRKALYQRLIGLECAIRYPAWFDRIKPLVSESITDLGLDNAAQAYMEKLVEQLELENQMLDYLYQKIPERTRTYIIIGNQEFQDLFPDYNEVNAEYVTKKQSIMASLSAFEAAYNEQFNPTMNSFRFRVLRELDIQADNPPPPLIVFDRFIRTISPGAHQFNIMRTIESHREQIDFIKEQLQRPLCYVLK